MAFLFDMLGWLEWLWSILKPILFFDWFSFAGKVLLLSNTLLFFALLLPGPEPEKTLYRFVKWLSRFSRKPELPPEKKDEDPPHNPT